MTDDWYKLFDKAQEIADAKGIPRTVMIRHFRRALRLIDRATSIKHRQAMYRWDGVRFDKRQTGLYRSFISKASAFKYQWRNGRGGFKYRSMIKREASSGYVGNLSHLVEDGGWNVKYNKPNRGHYLRRAAFLENKDAAERAVIEGIKEAVAKI